MAVAVWSKGCDGVTVSCIEVCWLAGGRGLRQALTPQAQRALIRSGSKRAEALEALTAQVADLQNTLQVSSPPLAVVYVLNFCEICIAAIMFL